VLDEYTCRDNALHCRDINLAVARDQEWERVLKALIATTQDRIEESRALITKIDKILAKRQ